MNSFDLEVLWDGHWHQVWQIVRLWVVICLYLGWINFQKITIWRKNWFIFMKLISRKKKSMGCNIKYYMISGQKILNSPWQKKLVKRWNQILNQFQVILLNIFFTFRKWKIYTKKKYPWNRFISFDEFFGLDFLNFLART